MGRKRFQIGPGKEKIRRHITTVPEKKPCHPAKKVLWEPDTSLFLKIQKRILENTKIYRS
jgi:hypothetical protein